MLSAAAQHTGTAVRWVIRGRHSAVRWLSRVPDTASTMCQTAAAAACCTRHIQGSRFRAALSTTGSSCHCTQHTHTARHAQQPTNSRAAATCALLPRPQPHTHNSTDSARYYQGSQHAVCSVPCSMCPHRRTPIHIQHRLPHRQCCVLHAAAPS